MAKMEMVKIEIVSREMIKPSSPTPHHLSNLKLSFLDQLSPINYIHTTFFYDSKRQNDHFEMSCLLKKSLAQCLNDFYPLAGRFDDQHSLIDCNDKGVEFVEARVDCKLSEVTSNPNNVKAFHQLLPFEPHGSNGNTRKEVLVAVQFNVFDCGGVALEVCVSHKVGDGTSLITFLKAWAARSRGASESETMRPNFDAATYFPPREMSGFKDNIGKTTEIIVTKRFVFDKSSIARLKEQASSVNGSLVKDPTRVEVVSALIWRTVIAITRSKQGLAKICVAIHAVNLRNKMVPQLSNNSFGNYSRPSIAHTNIYSENDHHILVGKIRTALRQMNVEFVKSILDRNFYANSLVNFSEQISNGQAEICSFTSWCRFPTYEVDFSWGNPSWVCSPSRPYKNCVVLMSTEEGDGIEAWVNMLEEDMAVFERDSELLSFVSSPKS